MRPTKIGLIAHTGKPGVAELTRTLQKDRSNWGLSKMAERSACSR